MHWKILKDKKNRIKLNKKEKSMIELKSLYYNEYLPENLRIQFGFLLQKKKVESSKIKNMCIYTERSRGVLKEFKVSRLVFKELARRGDILGISKSSW